MNGLLALLSTLVVLNQVEKLPRNGRFKSSSVNHAVLWRGYDAEGGLVYVPAGIRMHAVHQPAAGAGEAYWNKVLPNTPIPTTIKELITPSVSISERGISLRTIKPQALGSFHWVKAATENQVSAIKDLTFHWDKSVPSGSVSISERGISLRTIKPQALGSFHWGKASTENQVSDVKDTSFYFFEKDLQPGNKLTWQFSRTAPSGQTLFISHEEANLVPFTTAKFPYILTHFSIQPNSVVAKIMYQTLEDCETPARMDGETKYCATSLESMVEFSMASIGTRNIQAVSTDVYVDKKESDISVKQQYTIISSSSSKVGLAKRLMFEGHGNNVVVCHAQSYAYAVFYCHLIKETKAYQVSLVGEDGTKVETVVVCHMDTAKFHPDHYAFKLLHVKPGTVPICHFLAQDSLVWEPKN